MAGHPNGRQKTATGLPDGVPSRPARTLVDFVLLFLFVLVAQVTAAHGVSAGGEDGLLFYPDVLATAADGESFRLDAGPEAQAARVIRFGFSQSDSAMAEDGGRFHLPRATPSGPAPVAMTTSAEPLPADHATTAQFDGPFPAVRDRLADAMLAAPAPDRAARSLDYAQFLIARMMLPEARGVVAALMARPDMTDDPSRHRAAGYAAIIARLGNGRTADLPAAWAGDPMWPAVVSGRPVSAPQLRAAVAALSGHSREVATAVVPLLFDLALAKGDTVIAAEILASAPTGTDLEGTALLDLMRGRLALAQGGADMAFDTFARVAETQGLAAAEARIALADMALSRDDPALLPQVSRLLQDGLPRWRGDATALRLRVRLARVAEDMGDLATAVEVMSMIRHEHPATPEASLAEDRIGVMVGLLTDRIASAETPLAEALATVRRLDPSLTGRGGWIAARAALAARLEQAGLDEAARAEYAALARLSPATLPDVDPAVLDRIALGHAALLLAAGKPSEAVAVLDRHSYPRRAEDGAGHAALRLTAGRTAMLPDQLLAALKVAQAKDIADPSVQLALAEVAVRAGQDGAALAAFDHGIAQADPSDRMRAAMIAGMAGDAARAARYAQGLDGDRATARRSVIDSLAAPRRSGDRLSVSGATSLITAAEQAGAAVDALLSDGGTP